MKLLTTLDLETKDHVIQALKAYPGAMIVIPYDSDFFEEICISELVDVRKFRFLVE